MALALAATVEPNECMGLSYFTYRQNIEWEPAYCEHNDDRHHHFDHLAIREERNKRQTHNEIIIY